MVASEHKEIRLLDTLRNEVFQKLPNTRDDLDDLLRDWAQRHHLNYEWVLDMARQLYRLSRVPNANFGTLGPAYEIPPFHPPPWAPIEPETIYCKRMVARFREFLDQSILECKQSRKPLQDRGSQSDHYRWAAEHVCLGWGWTEIAKKHRRSLYTQAIRDAVLKVLEKVGIPRNLKLSAAKKRSF